MFLFKTVKPDKMKTDAFRLEFLSMLNKAATEIKVDFDSTTKTWEHEVKFETIKSLKGGPSILVGTDDEIYRYVNNGTEEHDISTEKPSGLMYADGYTPKTTVGVIGSKKGGKFGKVRGHGMIVTHPGIEARNFDELIRKRWEKKFKTRAIQAMKTATEKCGHKYPKGKS